MGQRPFGTFPKNHRYWYSQASLSLEVPKSFRNSAGVNKKPVVCLFQNRQLEELEERKTREAQVYGQAHMNRGLGREGRAFVP